MLNPFKLKAGFVPLVLFLIASAAHAGGGDHGAGNGGDGLLLSRAESLEDVVVPVPGDFGRSTTFELVGEAGAGQGEVFTMHRCQTNAAGEVLSYSCATLTQLFHLNQEVSVSAGTYQVAYQGSNALIQIAQGERKTVALSKVQVPAYDNSAIHFRVFLDFTDARVQDEFLRMAYISRDNQWLQSRCRSNEAYYPATCARILRVATFESLRNNAIFFDESSGAVSTFYHFHLSGRTPWRRVYLHGASSSAGFISVLPGVYGIEFTDTRTGLVRDQYGIVVE